MISSKTIITFFDIADEKLTFIGFEMKSQAHISFDKVYVHGSVIDAQPRWQSLLEAIDVSLQSTTFYSMEPKLWALIC